MGDESKKTVFDYLKTSFARAAGSVGTGTAYAFKGPETIEKTYNVAKDGVEKIITYAKSGVDKVNLKTATQTGASGLLAVLAYKLTGKAFENYDSKKEEK